MKMTILKRDDEVPYGFIVDISLSRLYKTIAEVPGVLFTDKRRFFWSSEDIHAEFVFKEHAYSIDPDPWEDGYWIVPKDKDATHPEIDEIRQHIETRRGCQQCGAPNHRSPSASVVGGR